MTSKECNKCKTHKTPNEFEQYITDKGIRCRNTCKKCRYTSKKAKYVPRKYVSKKLDTEGKAKKKIKDRRNVLKWRLNSDQRKQKLMETIGQTICRDCGKSDTRCLVFHHRDPKQKSFSIAKGFANIMSFIRLLEESKKCDVLCQNCHLKLHATSQTKSSKKYKYRKQKLLLDMNKEKCNHCDCCDWRCLTFHHSDRSTKKFEIPIGLHRYSYQTVLEEALKCQVLCHNCHHILHYNEYRQSLIKKLSLLN